MYDVTNERNVLAQVETKDEISAEVVTEELDVIIPTPAEPEIITVEVPGIQGPAGKDGKVGRDGRDGRDGKDGRDGEQGPQGEPGASVVSEITISADGRLKIVTL